MASARQDAQDALYKSIAEQVGKVGSANATPGTKASIIQRLAIAYRAVEGGPQPGSTADAE